MPFSSVGPEDEGESVDPDRFHPADRGQARRFHWAIPPAIWSTEPDERLLAGETRELILRTIETLPPNQRAAIVLHNIEAFSSEEVRNELDVEKVQRAGTYFRAPGSKVEAALEDYLGKPR